jgi:hypothetical protein
MEVCMATSFSHKVSSFTSTACNRKQDITFMIALLDSVKSLILDPTRIALVSISFAYHILIMFPKRSHTSSKRRSRTYEGEI